MSQSEAIVQVRDLKKQFGKTKALDGVSLDLLPGRITGLLGANAAGKSTLLRHIIGLYLPDAGTCTTLGCPAKDLTAAHLSRIGYVHQDGELLDWMTAWQLIRYVAAYYPRWNPALEARFVADFEIPLKARVGTLSPGQRQRLAILLAIGFEPELLILDEPAASLDPLARLQFLELLLGIIQDPGRTIVISSHILSDVEKIIDHTVIMDRGRILRDCPFDQLQEEFCRLRVTAIGDRLPDPLPLPGTVIECQRADAEAMLVLRTNDVQSWPEIEQRLKVRIERLPLALEDLYRFVVQGKGAEVN